MPDIVSIRVVFLPKRNWRVDAIVLEKETRKMIIILFTILTARIDGNNPSNVPSLAKIQADLFMNITMSMKK